MQIGRILVVVSKAAGQKMAVLHDAYGVIRLQGRGDLSVIKVKPSCWNASLFKHLIADFLVHPLDSSILRGFLNLRLFIQLSFANSQLCKPRRLAIAYAQSEIPGAGKIVS